MLKARFITEVSQTVGHHPVLAGPVRMEPGHGVMFVGEWPACGIA